MNAKVGDKIKIGQTLATIHSSDDNNRRRSKRENTYNIRNNFLNYLNIYIGKCLILCYNI